jgi:proteic killer suppression protein
MISPHGLDKEFRLGSRITADTALRLGLYFGNSPEFWLDLQSRYELKILRRRMRGGSRRFGCVRRRMRIVKRSLTSGIQPAVAEKLRRMMSFLQDMAKEDELKSVPAWKAHKLTGDRKGTWSLSVTRNWRLTFRIDQDEIEIIDLDYEDYH